MRTAVAVMGIAMAGVLGLPGCAAPTAAAPPGDLRTLVFGGRERTYRVTPPPEFESAPERPLPLVLAFHGTRGSGAQMRELSHLDEVAGAEGFLVVYPDGVNGEWSDGRPGINEDVDDVGFVRALLDRLTGEFPIDTARVYATGLSNGGHMCFRLAFDLSERIAAIAPVGALLSVALADRGALPRQTPVLLIAGDADPISPYAGGVVGGALLDRGEVLPASATVAFWTAANGAVTTPATVDYNADVDPDDGTRARVESYPAAAAGGADVVLIAVEGGGHTWPGGEQYLPQIIIGKTSRDFSAAETIWRFFAPRRRG